MSSLMLNADAMEDIARTFPDRKVDEPTQLCDGAVASVPISIWAAGRNTPLTMGTDARLPAGTAKTAGQDFWDIGTNFANFADLATQLGGGGLQRPSFVGRTGPIQENDITKLGILAHGGPGGIDIDCSAGRDFDTSVANDPTLLNKTTLSNYTAQFAQIERVLMPRAVVYFMSCLAAASTVGDELVSALSMVWQSKRVQVIGFKSVLFCDALKQKGDEGSYPGARETNYSNNYMGGAPRKYMTPSGWDDLDYLPWAHQSTPHASVAILGRMVKTGQEGTPWGP